MYELERRFPFKELLHQRIYSENSRIESKLTKSTWARALDLHDTIRTIIAYVWSLLFTKKVILDEPHTRKTKTFKDKTTSNLDTGNKKYSVPMTQTQPRYHSDLLRTCFAVDLHLRHPAYATGSF